MTIVKTNKEYRIRKLWHSDDCTHHSWTVTADELIEMTFERIADSEVRRYERFGKTVPITNCEAWMREFGSGLENPPGCWELAASARRSGYELAPLDMWAFESTAHFEFENGQLASNVTEPPWRGYVIFGDRPRCLGSCACVCHRCDDGCASCDCECRGCYCKKTCVVAERDEDVPKVVGANAERGEEDAVPAPARAHEANAAESDVSDAPSEPEGARNGVLASAVLGGIWKVFVVLATILFLMTVLARVCGGVAPVEQCYDAWCDRHGAAIEMDAGLNRDIGVP